MWTPLVDFFCIRSKSLYANGYFQATPMRVATSVFFEHYERLVCISDLDLLKESILDLVEQIDMEDMDKRKIRLDVNRFKSRVQLQSYLTNSMLKFQGLGVK